MNDKRIRQLVIAILVVLLLLGLLSLVSTVFQLIVPLALLVVGGFAFYKIAIEGRDKPETMDDEIAESAGIDAFDGRLEGADDARAQGEAAAQDRLSAVDQAQGEFFDKSTPAEEILDHIKQRRERLAGDDET